MILLLFFESSKIFLQFKFIILESCVMWFEKANSGVKV